MSLLDNASLLLTPNAYKEGKLYSVIPSNGNGDFTATRATTATRVNSAGLVDLVPYNLLVYSEQFDNAAWSKTLGTLTPNVINAPNGTLTADLFTKTSAINTVSEIATTSITYITTGAHTLSVYVKPNVGNQILLRLDNAGNTANFVFNFTTKTFTNTGANVISSSFDELPNGWFRLKVTGNVISTGWTLSPCNLFSNPTNDSLYIWGAQLVEGTSARDYLRTETRLNIPRVDYSLGGCPNILLEPQRTNLALQSSSFDSASWTKSATTATANTTISPSGIQDADTFTANGTNNQHYVVGTASGNVTSGVAYTMSVYMKKGTNNFAQLWLTNTVGGMWANFDLNNGVVGSLGTTTGTPPTSSIQSVGNGWYRCIMTFTPTTTAAGGLVIGIITSASSARGETNTLSTSVFLWGAQLEAGAYATSYIPTTTASVTRNADSITRNNIFTNGLITAAGGTWFVELRNNVARVRDSQSFFGVGDTTPLTANSLVLIPSAVSGRLIVFKAIGGSFTSLFTTTTDTCKIAIKWNGATADVFQNGVKVVSATAFTPTNMNILGNPNVGVPLFINEMALFPTPLTDAQCLALTA